MNAAKLAQPLDPGRVRHREGGGGRSLSYLEGHDVVRTANDIFGYGGWSYVLDKLTCLGTEDVTSTRNGQTKQGIRVAYSAQVIVRIGNDDCQYGDVGYGDAVEYTGSILTAHELAMKEAVTDGLKRCLKNLGDQFGLCLYDKAAPEHSGASRSVDGGLADKAAAGKAGGAPRSGAPVPAAASNDDPGEFVWKYGPHKGLKLSETPLEYVINYAEQGQSEVVRGKCRAFLETSPEGWEQAAVPAGAGYDEDIPFAPTIDGLQ